MGFALAYALFFDELNPSTQQLNSVLIPFLAMVAGMFVAILAAALVFRRWIMPRLINWVRAELGHAVEDAVAVHNTLAEGNLKAALGHVWSGSSKAAVWYSSFLERKITTQLTLGLVIAFGGLVGTVLLFRQTVLLGEQNQKLQEQTALLRDQNTKLDLQTVTAEAQRRAGLLAELFSIVQEVARIRDQINKQLDVRPPNEASEPEMEAVRLPPGLVARIVAFTRTATQYWTAEVPGHRNWSDGFVERTIQGAIERVSKVRGLTPVPTPVLMPRLAERPRSPERGQLLLSLVAADVDIGTLTRAGATFADADLRNAVLTGANLQGADLKGADLRDAYLIGANLRETKLYSANLQRAVLVGADLRQLKVFANDLDGAYLLDAIIADRHPQDQSPTGLPQTRSMPPPGWELYEQDSLIRLRQANAPPSVPPSSPRAPSGSQ